MLSLYMHTHTLSISVKYVWIHSKFFLRNFPSIIALMMEAVRTSETSISFKVTTRRYIPEDSKPHTRRRENLKSHFHSFSSYAFL
jgi:hypothetical protein